jgi:hypothetical protein
MDCLLFHDTCLQTVCVRPEERQPLSVTHDTLLVPKLPSFPQRNAGSVPLDVAQLVASLETVFKQRDVQTGLSSQAPNFVCTLVPKSGVLYDIS